MKSNAFTALRRAAAAAVVFIMAFSACTADASSVQSAALSSEAEQEAVSADVETGTETVLEDSLGNKTAVPNSPRVISLYGSFAEAWLLAGGELVGVTEDAFSEHDLGLDAETVAVVGSVKEPNLEEIIALEPQLVIMSADIANQEKLRPSIESAGIACVSFRVDSFAEYETMMGEFIKLTGREDLYEKNVTAVKEKIDETIKNFSHGASAPEVLLLRASSSSVKAKADDNLAGVMLEELGCVNIASENPSLLEDLSIEAVIEADPDFIFVLTMGDEAAATAYFDELTGSNPTWSELTAVKEGRCCVLPKELFHYKPNNRWGESYEYLAGLLSGNSTPEG